jgi:hypothetical protein
VTETGDPYTFEDVARFLCKGAPPNQKLAQHFRRWARPMEDYPQIPRTPPMTRKKVVEALKALDAASNMILAGLLNVQPMHFVMSAQFPVFDRLAMIRLLSDLRMRCQVSISSPTLSSKGRVKSGPETYPGYGADPRLFCASAILLAWQVVHRKYPGARNPWATKAAEALFHLVEPKRAPRRKTKKTRRKLLIRSVHGDARSRRSVGKSPCLARCMTGMFKASIPLSRKTDLAWKPAHRSKPYGDSIIAENSGNLVHSRRLGNQPNVCRRDTHGVRRFGCPRRHTTKKIHTTKTIALRRRARSLKTRGARPNGRLKDQARNRNPPAG